MTYKERKVQRTEDYEKNIKGWKLLICPACSGSGYYDNTGSPKCGSCEGTGVERVSPDYYMKAIEWGAETPNMRRRRSKQKREQFNNITEVSLGFNSGAIK